MNAQSWCATDCSAWGTRSSEFELTSSHKRSANAEQYWPCAAILVGGERAVPDVLARFQPAAGEAWFDLIYDAMIAEVRASPPQRGLPDEQKTVVLADLGSSARPRRHLFHRAPRESGSGDMLERCARERQLYATVNAWEGPRRAAADLLLTTADSFLVGDLPVSN
jgi:hypothetical protein